ncbi:MAG TPA: hypothetical protein DCQ06_05820 [Myxococcales bacterium]|nr:hypothetical protein [Myxococcales bacterium]HAN31098.1 hypothetical protein [Myxococcales bacterium]
MSEAEEHQSPELSAVERYKLAKEARKTAPPMQLPETPAYDQDTLWRGLTRGGEVRLLLVRATNAARESTDKLGCSAEAAGFVAELMAATSLLKACLNPDEQLQVSAQNSGLLGNFVIDCFATGEMRATVRHPEACGARLVGDGLVQVARIIRHSGTHRSSIELGGAMPGQLLMRYLLESEQIVSYINLDVAIDEQGRVQHALGFLLQLMPEGRRQDIATIVDNLKALPPLSQGMTAEDPDAMKWSSRLMEGLYWDQAVRQSVRFHCPCSAERVVALISTLPRSDIEELVADDAPLETTCDYCRTTYSVPIHQVRQLLELPS